MWYNTKKVVFYDHIRRGIHMDNDFLRDKLHKELNFRGLGGYVMQDGRKVKNGTIFRSGEIGRATPEELEYIKGLGIKTVFDFRNAVETQKCPDPKLPGAEHINMCAAFDGLAKDFDYSPLSLLDMLSDEDQTGNAAATMYSALTASIAFTNKAYEELFKTLMAGNTPVLFHCSGGKDRTGVAAVLILLALGASEETIKEDYLLSNVYLEELIEDRLDDHILLAKLSDNYKTHVMASEGVIPESVHMLLEEIKERYTTYEGFFLNEHGIDAEGLEKLRSMYLE